MQTAKPHLASGYSGQFTELAESVLLEVWSRLGDFHEHLVLVGGLAPRYLIEGAKDPYGVIPPHCGTMDVDLGISLAVADLQTYATVRATLVDHLGFRPALNEKGGEQRHSFICTVKGFDVTVDFLTTGYGGPAKRVTREVEEELSAIQVEGLGLALSDPVRIPVEGRLLQDGLIRTTLKVCRPLPYVILKALALKKRHERKDAYDLVYVLRYYKDGPSSVARETTPEFLAEASVQNALAALRNEFASPDHVGPQMVINFLGGEPANEHLQAFAAVQEFLETISKIQEGD